MSTRLQVVMSDDELAQLKEAAARDGVTLSEWVRRSLRDASRDRSRKDPQRLLDAIEKAYQYSFPAPDIEQMLVEIEQGYLDDPSFPE